MATEVFIKDPVTGLIGPIGTGNISSGTADSGNPVKIGAVFNTVQPTVASGQRVDAQADNRGNLKVNVSAYDPTLGDINGLINQPNALAINRWNYAGIAGGIVSSAAEFTIANAAGVGLRNYVSSFNIGHDLLSAAVEFVIRDGSAGTILYRAKLQANANEDSRYVPINPIRGTANTAVIGQILVAVTGGVYINSSGFIGA